MIEQIIIGIVLGIIVVLGIYVVVEAVKWVVSDWICK